ncbi:DNA starvation/stationary phase protection protein [Euzebyella marina]|uniref:DNA starvation/stationary phase protection protein n=1 Tax=Euzebyella marina TaxID=1761453 RepID=A0A3G2L5Q8_9FLAO|nr:Dps family protein [Euzebyella marina]AYN67595.1 DNA starvation/stationary phase protection protein [Euzebyella marina]
MGNINKIGLDAVASEDVAKKLNDLLSNYQLFYMNLRGFHWNIKGKKFFELHLKFEKLYNEALVKIDELAERALTLGATPIHSYEGYLKTSEIKSVENVTDGATAVDNIIGSLGILLKKERTILALAAEAGDEGTVALMSEYIVEQEKLVWMLSAYLD